MENVSEAAKPDSEAAHNIVCLVERPSPLFFSKLKNQQSSNNKQDELMSSLPSESGVEPSITHYT